jgi:hypothetical protein
MRRPGGNTRQPFATKNTARLADFRIAHHEILSETPTRREAVRSAPA